jgi:hypothetical protein
MFKVGSNLAKSSEMTCPNADISYNITTEFSSPAASNILRQCLSPVDGFPLKQSANARKDRKNPTPIRSSTVTFCRASRRTLEIRFNSFASLEPSMSVFQLPFFVFYANVSSFS